MESSIHEGVKNYYGNVLKDSSDLQTDACKDFSNIPAYIKSSLSNVHDEVLAKYYGCGLVVPTTLKNTSILDLGSGSGRDCYVLSQLVGEDGFVTGVDMTDEQLEVANRHIDYHMDKFKYKKRNIEFKKGHIEELDKLGLKDNSYDVIVSNCVINLNPHKERVFEQCHRVLREGGELYFSDIYSDRRVPEHLINDPVLRGECLSGALYWNDFLTLANKSGFIDPRMVECRALTIENESIRAKLGNINFYSVTYRLFKIGQLEKDCEDYGQAVIYKGTIEEAPNSFMLDGHHLIEKGKVFDVCGNTHLMLNRSRLSEHFEYIGNMETHYGIFEGCGMNSPFKDLDVSTGAGPAPSSCC